jgi:hypothetical protein
MSAILFTVFLEKLIYKIAVALGAAFMVSRRPLK